LGQCVREAEQTPWKIAKELRLKSDSHLSGV
jgi:hypothetical protein